jgi:hypothetical protein
LLAIGLVLLGGVIALVGPTVVIDRIERVGRDHADLGEAVRAGAVERGGSPTSSRVVERHQDPQPRRDERGVGPHDLRSRAHRADRAAPYAE